MPKHLRNIEIITPLIYYKDLFAEEIIYSELQHQKIVWELDTGA